MTFSVCLCGGGNGCHTAAGYIGSKLGFEVNVLTRRPKDWSNTIEVYTKGSSWEYKTDKFVGRIHKVSDDPAEVVPGCQMVIVCSPAHTHRDILKSIAPHVDDGASVGALYCQGGFDWAARNAFGGDAGLKRLKCIWGLQNIPWICNLYDKQKNYGKRVYIIGPKQHLWLASSPPHQAPQVARQVEQLFDIPTKLIANFLSLTLTPSNQIIHPARYYAIFQDWDGQKTYSQKELENRQGLELYRDMDELGAEQLACLDNELQTIKFGLLEKYPQLDLTRIIPIGERIVFQYGPDVADTSSLRKIFQTNLGYDGCKTPKVEVSPGQFRPAIESRLFVEDIPFGLVILKNIAELLGFPTPRIDFFIEWHQQFMSGKTYLVNGRLNQDPTILKETGAPYAYGIYTLHDLVKTSLTTSTITSLPPLTSKL